MSSKNDPRSHVLEPKMLTFLQAFESSGDPPVYTLTPNEARTVFARVQRSGSRVKLPAEIEDRVISGGPTGQIALRIVRPQGAIEMLPAILYFHGGGWVLGDKETHDRLIREIANGVPAAVIFVDYDRSPEARYPIAIEQGYAALTWLTTHGDELCIDITRLAVVGDSVGGNMAAVTTLLAKERQGPEIAFQVLFYPVTNADLNTHSYHQYGDGSFWLTSDSMKWSWDSYVEVSKRKDPTVSPLQASLEQLRGLPPALIITIENDVLRDEGEAYAHKLQEANVEVTATRYLGVIHDFIMLNAVAESSASRAAIRQANDALSRAFERKGQKQISGYGVL
ncbi:alpha/beta hydrolase [Dictyobacter formicarum]|uniref:Esterase n=1 Tax=Dictyobacter formicarum TaxID=2778368 RepID=A0ABQ3V9Q5_9CHLR|nr:alpha/beta hydrolase [Dictyobacter formicarum]GHO82543.1 esterase [Dictyobacter formicarum]